MGLLDTLDDPGMRLGLGLLAAAAPRFDNAGIGQRLMEGVGSLDAWKQQQAKQKLIDLQSKAAQQQIDEGDLKIAAMKQADQVRKLLPTLYEGGSQGLAPLAGDPSTGILPSAGRPATQGQFNIQKAIAMGLTPEQIKAYADLPNAGRQEVTRMVDVEGPNGEKLAQGYDKFGQPIGTPIAAYTAPQSVDLKDRVVFAKPQAGMSFQVGQSPDSKASNAVAWANNAIQRQRLAFDMAGGAEAIKPDKPEFRDGQWIMPPKDMKPGESRQASGAPAKEANDALTLISQAEKLLKGATGSGIGTGIDAAYRFFGATNEGDTKIGQLQALEGALVAKMPKMSGPQSDKDVALYKQMAGQIGDPMMPAARKMAALQTIKEIQQRYANQGGATGTFAPTGFKILSVE